MTIKAQKTFLWGVVRRPVRVLEVGETVSRLGLVDPIAKEGAVEIMRVTSPDEISLHQKLVGSYYPNPERPLGITINGKNTDRLVREEITDYGSWQTVADLLVGYRDRVWWEPTEIHTSKERER